MEMAGEKNKHRISRIKSGVAGLDGFVEGGFEKGATILIVGSAGTGKTILGLQYLYYGALEEKEPGIFISFEEDQESLLTHMSGFDLDFDPLLEKNQIKILSFKPHEVQKLIQSGGGMIRDEIESMKAKRLVVDSITAYELLFKDSYQERESVLELFENLKKWGCTSLIISEMSATEAITKNGSEGFLTDGIIALYYDHEPRTNERIHKIEIIKMRGTNHSDKSLGLEFKKEGISISDEMFLLDE